MLQKLKSREPIDLPVEHWRKAWLLRMIFVGLLVLFIVIPALGALGLGLKEHPVGVARGVAGAFIALLGATMFSKRKALVKRRA
ncbi:MAG: hypothetical protein ACYDCK_01265 [Thermoplasmatota archaeon]